MQQRNNAITQQCIPKGTDNVELEIFQAKFGHFCTWYLAEDKQSKIDCRLPATGFKLGSTKESGSSNAVAYLTIQCRIKSH